jgi:hypothetical protein
MFAVTTTKPSFTLPDLGAIGLPMLDEQLRTVAFQ